MNKELYSYIIVLFTLVVVMGTAIYLNMFYALVSCIASIYILLIKKSLEVERND